MPGQQRRWRLGATVAAVTLVAAACTSTQGGDGPPPEPPTISEATVPNQGGDLEGHTPIGFPGTGTGLFVGDNLNSGFPDGDGVQTFMTFALPNGIDPTTAILSSDMLQTRGTPFNDLGVLMVERLEYETFGADLFDLPATGGPTPCTVTGDTTVSCDVTGAVKAAMDAGSPTVQFRLRFERVADNDGQPDLAMFFRTDSNTNEPGLFTLVITGP